MQHPFFSEIDFNKLVEFQIEAPYKPEINTADPDQSSNMEDQMNVQSDIKSQDAFEQMPESQIQYIRENQD